MAPGPAGAICLPRTRPPTARSANVRVLVHDLHLGVSDAGRDNCRPVEPDPPPVSFRDVLLRAEVLHAVSRWADAEGAWPKKYDLGRSGLGGRGCDGAPRAGRLTEPGTVCSLVTVRGTGLESPLTMRRYSASRRHWQGRYPHIHARDSHAHQAIGLAARSCAAS